MHAKVIGTMVVALVVAAGASRASAGPILWADWQRAVVGVSGSASGTMDGIAVSYAGEVSGPTQVAGGNNYYVPATTWQSATVPNAPPCCDVIAMDLATQLRTISFGTPVTNPLMAIVSMGRPSLPVYYDFDAPFDILSMGPGAWGGPGTLTEFPNDVLMGVEGNGVIQFLGTFSSISWTSTPSEYWHGFTVGTVPEPAMLGLFGLAAAAGAMRRRLRRG